MALENFCFIFPTKTGAIIVGCFNIALSIFVMIFYSIFAAILGLLANDIGLGSHWVIIMAYVLSGIGIFFALLLIIFSSVLIHGVRKRKPKYVFAYLIFGTISAFVGLIILNVATFTVFLLIGSFMIGGLQVYFVLIVNKEYRNIQAEKRNGTVGQYPSGPVGQYPSGPVGQYPSGPVGQYPSGPVGQYPSGPVGQYPSGPVGQYPSGPVGQYPSGPMGQYPSGPVGQFPCGPVGQFPSGPMEKFPMTSQEPAIMNTTTHNY